MKTKQVGKKILSGLLTVCLVAGSIVITKPQNADAAGDNLVANGGFDTTENWYDTSDDTEVAMPEQEQMKDVEIVEHIANGDFEDTAYDYNEIWSSQSSLNYGVETETGRGRILHVQGLEGTKCMDVNVKLEAGKTYTISFDIKGTTESWVSYNLYAAVNTASAEWTLLDDWEGIPTEWTRRTYTYTPTIEQNVLIFQNCDGGSGDFYIDNFSVTTERTPVTEHIPNGDFEDVAYDYSEVWSSQSSLNYGVETETGRGRILHVQGLEGTKCMDVNVKLEAGKTYTISFDIKGTTESWVSYHLYAAVNTASTEWTLLDDWEGIPTEWTKRSYTYTPTIEQNVLIFQNCDGGSGDFYIDNFSVTTERESVAMVNIIPNGDFENAECDYSEVWSSRSSLTYNVETEEGRGRVLRIQQFNHLTCMDVNVALKAGKTYTISFDVKSVANETPGWVSYYLKDASWNVIKAWESIPAEWTTRTYTYTPETDQAGLIFQSCEDGAGDFYIDNFSVTTEMKGYTYSEGIGNCLGEESDNVLAMKEMTEATYKNVSIIAGKTYEYSYKVKTDKAASVAFAVGEQAVQTKAATSEWTNVSGEFTATSNARELSFVRSGEGSLLIDDIEVYEVAEEVVPDNHTTMEGGGVHIPTGHRNLFVEPQGTFEDASNAGCVLAKGKGTMTGGMAKLPIINNDNEWLETSNVSVEANKEYTFSAYVYVTGAIGDLQINLYTGGVGCANSSWVDYALGSDKSITANTEGWQLVQYTWTPQQSGTVYFGIKNYGTASTATVYVDDFSLTTVKEKVKTTLSKAWMGIEDGATAYTMHLGVSNYADLVAEFGEWSWFEGEILIDGTPTKLRFNLGSNLFATLKSIPSDVTSVVIPAGTEFIDEDGSCTKLLVTENELEISTLVVPDNHTTMEGGGVYIPTGHKNLFVEPQGTFEDASNAGCVLAKGKGTMTDGMAKLPIINNDNEWLETASVNVEANKEYTFSAYVYVTGATGDLQINLYTGGVGCANSAWVDFALGSDKSITTNTEGWQLVQYTWTPQQSGTVYFGIKNYGTASTATVYVDDFSLTTEKGNVQTTISLGNIEGNTQAYTLYLYVSNYDELCQDLGEWSWLDGEILVDGEPVTVGFNLGSNTLTAMYHDQNTTAIIPSTATSISIPAGTQFIDRDNANSPVLVIENDFNMVKHGQGWAVSNQEHEYVANEGYADDKNVRYYNISNGDYLLTSSNNAIEVEENKELTTGDKITVNDLEETNVFHISRIEDEELWKETVVLYIPGDANEDEVISAKDLVAMKWAETKTSEKQKAREAGTYASDLDRSGEVDGIDLRALRLALVSDDAEAELAVSKSDSLLGGEMPIAGFDMPRAGHGDDQINDDFYKLIADAHINTIVWSMDGYDQAGYGLNADKHMALADKWGLKMWVHDYSTDAASTDRFTNDNFAKRVGAYSMYESFAGIHIVDEPDLDTNWLAGDEPERKISIFKDDIALCNSTANISGYMNLLPYYPHLEDAFPNLTVAKYQGYLTKTYTDTKAEMLSVDHYPFRVNDTGIIIDKWTKVPYKEYLYKNLDMMRTEANNPKNAGKPFWSYAQLTLNAYENQKLFDDDDYMTAGEVQWQVNTALALGARGIQYWSVYAETNYSEMAELGYAGLINPDGTKSNYYDVVQKQNSFIKAIDEVLMNATNEGIFVNDSTAKTAFNEINSGVVLTDADSDVLKSVSGDNALVGCFDYYGKTVFYVVNCNTEAAQNITLNYDAACKVAVTNFTGPLNRTLSEAASSTTISVGAGQAALVIVE